LPAQVRAHPSFHTSRLKRQRNVDYAAVLEAAARADKLAVELRDRAIRVWAGTLVSLIHAYDQSRGSAVSQPGSGKEMARPRVHGL